MPWQKPQHLQTVKANFKHWTTVLCENWFQYDQQTPHTAYSIYYVI